MDVDLKAFYAFKGNGRQWRILKATSHVLDSRATSGVYPHPLLVPLNLFENIKT